MENTLRVAGTIGESIVDGPGLRYVIFTQGCPHNCLGCHNPETHAVEGGIALKLDVLLGDILRNPLLSGVTFSGGEPFSQAAALVVLATELKKHDKHIMIYSGYTFEQLLTQGEDTNALLHLCDILVDGPYMQSLRDLSLRFRGSRNQRVLNVPASLKEATPIWVPDYQQVPGNRLI